MSATKNTKQFILFNRLGQAVRTIQKNHTKAVFIKNNDSGRIEIYSSLKEISDLNISHEVLANTSFTSIKKGAVSLQNYGEVRYAFAEPAKISRSVFTPEESDNIYRKMLKWSGATHVIVALLLLTLGYFLNPELDKKPEKTITVVQQKIARRRPTPQPTTVVREAKVRKKISRVKPKKSIKRHNKTRVRQLVKRPSRNKKRNGRKLVGLNQMGALGVLGSLSKNAKNRAGINLNAVKTTAGPGLGGSGGSGGVQKSIYSRGIIAAPVGSGNKVKGGGGYGTRGKGGGQAGYGQMSLAGSSAAYFAPVTQEAFIQGGLDRDQVAEVINRNIGHIRYCYERALQVQPKLKGRVSMDFVINSRGRVSTAKIGNSTLRSKKVESCMVKKLRAWKFPRPVGGVNVKVKYPFNLRRSSHG